MGFIIIFDISPPVNSSWYTDKPVGVRTPTCTHSILKQYMVPVIKTWDGSSKEKVTRVDVLGVQILPAIPDFKAFTGEIRLHPSLNTTNSFRKFCVGAGDQPCRLAQ